MDSQNKQDHPPQPPTVTGQQNAVPPQKPGRQIRLKKAIILATITSLITAIIVSAGLAGAFLVGRSFSISDLEQSRQTIVQEGEVISDVAQRVGPSVVSIVTEQQSSIESEFFGTRNRISRAAGTGIVIDRTGLIITNKHVVPESASSVQVVMSDGTRYDEAEVIGRDPLNDIAIIRVDNPENFVPAVLGNSDEVRTGQKVIAIGNALGQFQNTVTSGIISGIGRPIEAGSRGGQSTEILSNLFQTDAAINSGNSGGPLLNYNGEVIGINTAVAANAENIGFSIPINDTKGVIESVKATGRVSRPFIGVQYVMLTADVAKELNLSVEDGALVSRESGSIIARSPAAEAGIEPGDIITKVNNIVLDDAVTLVSAVGRFKVGDTVELTIIRGGNERKLSVTLAEAPQNN